jgi:hypothetical protein
MDKRLDCGHTEREHEQMSELDHLVEHVQVTAINPRVALIVQDDGTVHFASSLPPHEAAAMLEKMAERVRRYGANYVSDHFDRGEAAKWN